MTLSVLKTVFKMIINAAALWIAGLPICAAQISLPADIANLAFHIDASDVTGTGVQPANASIISSWADLSGNNYDLTAVSGNEPYFESTGFDGLRPAIRFETNDEVRGPDVLPSTAGAMTIFFVMSNASLTRNTAVRLNGNSSNRYQFHTPWSDSRIYFDAGYCCAAPRVAGTLPNPITETSVHTAQNDLAGGSQFIRVDGAVIASDSTGHASESSGGVRLGSGSGIFDGRFAELIIYSAVLSNSQIESIEEYLYCKWKPALATTPCAVVTASKQAQILSSPVENYSLPGSTVRYTISANNEGPFDADSGTVVITDAIPANTALSVADISGLGTGPVIFTDGSPASNMTYSFTSLASMTDDVDFSDDGGVTYIYVPIPDGLGLDSNVTHLRISPDLPFSAGTSSSPSSFAVSFDVYLQ